MSKHAFILISSFQSQARHRSTLIPRYTDTTYLLAWFITAGTLFPPLSCSSACPSITDEKVASYPTQLTHRLSSFSADSFLSFSFAPSLKISVWFLFSLQAPLQLRSCIAYITRFQPKPWYLRKRGIRSTISRSHSLSIYIETSSFVCQFYILFTCVMIINH